jgi:hypothetical protein
MKKSVLCLTVIFVFILFQANGQNDTTHNPYGIVDTLEVNSELFDSYKILELSLQFDINQFKRKKLTDEYQKAVLTYYINDTDSIVKKVKVKSRGITRREICSFPPIGLNFNISDSSKADRGKIENIKMVTHCNAGKEDYLFKEYLIYRLYSILTDQSFKVRLVKIKYIDSQNKNKPVNTYAFIIEPLQFLAKRLHSAEVKSKNLTMNNIVPESLDRMAIFNYMIGNTDWSVPLQHNCKILYQAHSSRPDLGIIIPYDFDYAGLVNANYAVPNEGLPITNVTERFFIGKCREEEVFMSELKEFTDKKEAFYKEINQFIYLDEKKRNVMIKYLDDFYDQIEKRNSIIYYLKSQCLK